MFTSKRIFSALGVSVLLATIAVADPPARVARINYLQGSVSLQRGDLAEWNQAVINYPMVANDSLWADDQARAELHIGSTAVRLSDQTSISFLNLNDQVVQIRLAKGTVEFHLNRLDSGESYEIDTPSASVSLLRTGDYRLEVDEAGNATIITRRGQAEVTAGAATFDVIADQQADVANSADPIYELSAPKPIDDFERWANDRTRLEEQCVFAQYVSREMIGYEDLDAYGVGRRCPSTEMCGRRIRFRRAGRRIPLAIGSGSNRMAGRGWMSRRGGSRRFITVDGRSSATPGTGRRGRWYVGRSSRPPWSALSAGITGACRWALAPASAGFRWGRVKSTSRFISSANATFAASIPRWP
jgi:hypothetical protein